MKVISSFDNDYYFLSNYFEAPIVYDGISYLNNEAAFQAQKCVDVKDKKKFGNLNPSSAKHLGRRIILRKDWEQVKFSIMLEIVRQKFIQNPDLAMRLVDTGDAYLEEGNTWGDRIWGTVNGQGANNLGKILMQVRDELENNVN